MVIASCIVRSAAPAQYEIQRERRGTGSGGGDGRGRVVGDGIEGPAGVTLVGLRCVENAGQGRWVEAGSYLY